MTDIVVGRSSLDRFLNSGIPAWKQEGGDRRPSATNLLVVSQVSGLNHASGFESKSDQIGKINQKMAASVPDEPIHSAGESSTGPRPLKSRPEDRIASIMDNPFYKSFGVRHPRSPRDVPSVSTSAKMSVDTDGKYSVREDLGDYRPGSGFVHKLMGKFSSLALGVREEPSVQHIKNASSVEDILDRTESHAVESGDRHRDRGRIMTNSIQHRARSVESLGRKKTPPNMPVVLRHVERIRDHPASSLKSPRDTHIVAPDVKLGRDDIILIENPPSEPTSAENEIEEDMAAAHMSGFKAEKSTDELPKPNTVSAVRSLFESGKPLSPTSLQSGELYSVDSESVFTPRDSVLTPRDSSLTSWESILSPRDPVQTRRDSNSTPRDTVLTPRDSVTPRDTVLTPRESVLSPRDVKTTHEDSKHYKPPSPRIATDLSQRHDASRSRFSWSSDHKTAGSVDLSSSAPPPLPTTLPPVSATAVPSAAEAKAGSDLTENVKPSLFQSSNGAENRPPASPRSTAAVKAIPASRSSVSAHASRPNSTSISSSGAAVPPSFTPSIKKTSPVMPVAPFKENKVEEGGDNRYLIYSKKTSNTKRQKATRLKDYGEGSTDITTDNTKTATVEELKKQDNDLQKSNKTNRTHTKGRAPPIPKQRQSDESLVSPRSSDSNETQWSDVFKPTSPRIEDSQPQLVTLTPVETSKPNKAPRTFFSKPEEKLEISKSVSLSEESKLDNEEMDKEEIKTEESNQPVKGIPSIIANRMKQNNQNQATESVDVRPPGELFGVRLGKIRHDEDTAEEENEIPRKRLAPAPEKTEKDASANLPSEIENQIASVRKRMEQASKNKSSGVSQIFDSSQLQKKRREKQAAKSSAASGVPRLDLSSITAEDSSSGGSAGGYRVTPREIKPCNIEFIGANVSTGRSLLKKNRKVKVSIRFQEKLEEIFEYPSEEAMLEEYIRQHPNEVLILEEETPWPTESSDDSEIPDTPRGGGGSSLDGELLKSNTSLAHSGNLQSYRGKYQQEYELGSVLNAPEKEPEPTVSMEPVDPDSMQILPGDEGDNQTWSLDTSSDLLF